MKLYSWMTQEKGIPHIPSNKNNCSQTQYYQGHSNSEDGLIWQQHHWLIDWLTDKARPWSDLGPIKKNQKLNWSYFKIELKISKRCNGARHQRHQRDAFPAVLVGCPRVDPCYTGTAQQRDKPWIWRPNNQATHLALAWIRTTCRFNNNA